MTDRATERLIETLAAGLRPAPPLAPPLRRGLLTLAALVAAGAALVLAAGNMEGLLDRYAGREPLLAAEMAAMLLTAAAAILGAFALSVPGGSRRWLLAPLAPFTLWVGLSGLGCYQEVVRLDGGAWRWGDSGDCLLFILGASLVVGLPLAWRLSRARPIAPLPVALLAGLGAAAASALLLQFFHPFALTALDLAVHFAAVLLVVALAALSRRRALAPA